MDVRLPDGTVVQNVPDGMSKADLASKLKANGMNVPDEWMAPPPQDPFNASSIGHGLLGAGEVAGAGLVNGLTAIPNAAADLVSRATGNGPAQPIPQVPIGQAGQETLTGIRGLLSKMEGTPNADTTIRQQIIAQRNKQLDGTFLGDVRNNAGPVLGDVATLAASAEAGAVKVANGTATAAEIKGLRPSFARMGFNSEQEAAGYQLGLRNGQDRPVSAYLSGSELRSSLINNNADQGNVVARWAARVPETIPGTPGITNPLTKEALDEALQPMEEVYRRAAASMPDGEQVIQKLRELRHDGYAGLNSDDPAAIARGRAKLAAADALEDRIGRNISPTSGTSLEQFQRARQAIAQNRTIYDVLRGHDVDLAALGRVYRNAPTNYFADGPLKTLAQWADMPVNRSVVGGRVGTVDTSIREGVDAASKGLSANPITWAPAAARLTGLPQRALLRGPGVDSTRGILPPRNPNEFAPLPMRGLSPAPGQVGIQPQQGSLQLPQPGAAQPHSLSDLQQPPGNAFDPYQRPLL